MTPRGTRATQLQRLVGSTAAARAALLMALVLATANFALTTRWAHIPGSVHGPKRLWFLCSLALLAVVALVPRRAERLDRTAALVAIGGVLLLGSAFFVWFPLDTWNRVPFLDDWPPRFQSTTQGLALLERGAFTGWQWAFLGGYHLSSDVTQSLTAIAAIPMWLLGERVGFHAAHLLLFAALPVLVYADCRIGRLGRGAALLAAGLVAIIAVNYSYFLIRSGDTNSLAGTVAATASLVSAHAAREGRRGSAMALVFALTLTNYSHRGFFVYTLILLAVDALVSRDRASGARAAIAAFAAWAAGLPLTWESWRYPSYFIFNNVQLARDLPFDVIAFARNVFYNTELLWLPGRWFNDYTGLANLLLPVTGLVAVVGEGRVRFHAWALLALMALVRLHDPQFGYSFMRPIHLYPVSTAVVCAGFVTRWLPTRIGVLALALFVGLYVQMAWFRVPHIDRLNDFDTALVERLRTLDGSLLALENSFHVDVDLSPQRQSERTPFGVHFEALLPEATGRYFYAGLWDGWQWSPYRHQVFANGTFQGRLISTVPTDELVAELRRWGIRHVLVWTDTARASLAARPGFVERWRSGRWSQIELLEADTRAVVLADGSGTLERVDPLRGRVVLSDVLAGQQVTVRMNYHPSWMAFDAGREVPVVEADGQVAFTAPRSGDYTVELVYPRRPWLLVVMALALVLGSWLASRVSSRARPEHGDMIEEASRHGQLPIGYARTAQTIDDGQGR